MVTFFQIHYIKHNIKYIKSIYNQAKKIPYHGALGRLSYDLHDDNFMPQAD